MKLDDGPEGLELRVVLDETLPIIFDGEIAVRGETPELQAPGRLVFGNAKFCSSVTELVEWLGVDSLSNKSGIFLLDAAEREALL